MTTMASQITSLTVIHSKLRVTGLCVGNSPGPVNSPHKGPVTRKMFPFDDVIMYFTNGCNIWDVCQRDCYDKPLSEPMLTHLICDQSKIAASLYYQPEAHRWLPFLPVAGTRGIYVMNDRNNYFARIKPITSTQVMVYNWWIPCETLVHTGSR